MARVCVEKEKEEAASSETRALWVGRRRGHRVEGFRRT
jgi:hypothetical protein